MGRTPLTPQNPGRLAAGLAKFISSEKGMRISGPQVQAVLSYKAEFVATDDWQNTQSSAAEERARLAAEREERAQARRVRQAEEARVKAERAEARLRGEPIRGRKPKDWVDPEEAPASTKRAAKKAPAKKAVAKTETVRIKSRGNRVITTITPDEPAPKKRPAKKAPAKKVAARAKPVPGPVDPEEDSDTGATVTAIDKPRIKRRPAIKAKTAGRKVSF